VLDPFKTVEVPGWTGAQEFDTIVSEDAFDAASGDRIGWVKPVASEKRSIKQGFEAFPSGDILKTYIQEVEPLEQYFDVGMHGTQTSVGFGTSAPSMSTRELANVILHDPSYHGQNIRLLSCDTGRMSTDGAYCVAEELANALGVTVIAPNDVIIIRRDGSFKIGIFNKGSMVKFVPNQRRRLR